VHLALDRLPHKTPRWEASHPTTLPDHFKEALVVSLALLVVLSKVVMRRRLSGKPFS
jgi:hypothetical protein